MNVESTDSKRPKESSALVRKLNNHLFPSLLDIVYEPRETKSEPHTGEDAKESPISVTAGECLKARRGQRRAHIGEEAKESPVPVTAGECLQDPRGQKRAPNW